MVHVASAAPCEELEKGDAEGSPPPHLDASPAMRYICFLALFLVRLEVSVLTIVIPLIASDFHISLELAAWVHFAPKLAGIMTAPSVGKLADLYGCGRTFRFSLFLMVTSVWLSAWAPNYAVLLVGRTLAGIAQSGLWSPGFALLTRGMDPTRRGVISSYMMALETIGSSTGVLAGGILVDTVQWRWIFRGPAPLLTLTWLGALLVIPTSDPPTRAKLQDPSASQQRATVDISDFDWMGTMFFAIASSCVLIALNRGNDIGWNSPWVWALAAAAALSMPLLVRAERKAAHPILPIWLLAKRTPLLLLITEIVTWSRYGSCFLLVPLYMQDAMGISPGNIGKLLTARPMFAFVTTAVVARFIKNRSFPFLRLAKFGCLVQLISYTILNVAVLMPVGFTFNVLLETQLASQAVGAFFTELPTNAMLVALLPEEHLANAVAIQGVVIELMELMMLTLNLSLIHAMGSEFVRASYRPTWFMLILLQVVIMITVCAVPKQADCAYKAVQEDTFESPTAATVGKQLEDVPLKSVDRSLEVQGQENEAPVSGCGEATSFSEKVPA